MPVNKYKNGYQGIMYQAGYSLPGPYFTVGPDIKLGKLHVIPLITYSPLFERNMCGTNNELIILPGGAMRYEMSESSSVWLSLGFPNPLGFGISKSIYS